MRRQRHREGGYALLLVCAMAASIAVMLYMEVPRVAFEAQRDKEQLLIDRGEQYTRAVQLYVRKYNRFPADIAALENTQSIRFLRKQYIDPMTGKSEWRLIHVGPGGVFTDSLVHKAKKDTNAPQTFITELQQIGGGGGPTGAEGANLATRRRPSDGTPGQDPFNPGGGGQLQPGGQQQPGQAPINGPVMVLPDGRIVPATASGQPSSAGGMQPGQGQMMPPGGQMPNGTGVQNSAGQFGFPMQGANGLPSGFQNQANGVPGPPPNAAANLINQILTTPRPGGLNGTDPQQGGAFGQQQGGAFGQALQAGASGGLGTPIQGAAGGQVIGGGIAGVASKAEREGIKVYGERNSYNEWEFVYDMSKEAAAAGGRGGVVPQTGQPGQGQSAPGTAPGGGMNPGGFQGGVPPR